MTPRPQTLQTNCLGVDQAQAAPIRSQQALTDSPSASRSTLQDQHTGMQLAPLDMPRLSRFKAKSVESQTRTISNSPSMHSQHRQAPLNNHQSAFVFQELQDKHSHSDLVILEPKRQSSQPVQLECHSSLSASPTSSTRSDDDDSAVAAAPLQAPRTPQASATPHNKLPMIRNQALHRKSDHHPNLCLTPVLQSHSSHANPTMSAAVSAYLSATSPNSNSSRLRGRRHSMTEERVMIPWRDPVTDGNCLSPQNRASLSVTPRMSGTQSHRGLPAMDSHTGTPKAHTPRLAERLGLAQNQGEKVLSSHQSSYATLSFENKTPVLTHRTSINAQPNASVESSRTETPTRMGPAQLAKQAIIQRRVSISQLDSLTRQSPTSMARQISSGSSSSGNFDLAQACDDAQQVWHHYSHLSKHHVLQSDSDSATLEKFNIDNDKIYTKHHQAVAISSDSGHRALSSHQIRQLAADLHTYYATQLRCMAAIEHPKFTTEQIEDCVARHLKASFDDKKDSQHQCVQIERLIRTHLSTKPSAIDAATDQNRGHEVEKLYFRQHWDKFLKDHFDVDAESQKLKEANLNCLIM